MFSVRSKRASGAAASARGVTADVATEAVESPSELVATTSNL